MQEVNIRPSRSKIFRDKMRVEKTKGGEDEANRRKKSPVHKRIVSREETR